MSDNLPFPIEFCFAPVGFFALVTACTAGAAVSGLHSQYRVEETALLFAIKGC